MQVAAKAAPPVTPAGSVVHPLVADGKGSAKAARPATVNVMARNVNNRRDALRRPQPVPHEKRRVA